MEDHMPWRASTSGKIVMRELDGYIPIRRAVGVPAAFATEDIINAANQELNKKTICPIVLERMNKPFKDTTDPQIPEDIKAILTTKELYRICPVFKSNKDLQGAIPENYQGDRLNEYQPVLGEDAAIRTQKRELFLAEYNLAAESALKGKDDAVRNLSASFVEFFTEDKKEMTEELDKKIRATLETCGLKDGVNYFEAQDDFFGALMGEFVTKKQGDHFIAWCEDLAFSDYLDRTTLQDGVQKTAEEDGNEKWLPITLPNDCGQAALFITGETELRELKDSIYDSKLVQPGIGLNYYCEFIAGSSPPDLGWPDHYAAVIMTDGKETLTFESAADRFLVTRVAKGIGYFGLYQQTADSRTRFARLLLENNAAYVARIHTKYREGINRGENEIKSLNRKKA